LGGALLLVMAALIASPAEEQPEPSFRATCGELRAKLAQLDLADGTLITIEVEGALTLVRPGPGISYLGMCAPPDPQVLCVTYGTGDLKVGDRTLLVGAISPRGPDHLLLDPCLPSGGWPDRARSPQSKSNMSPSQPRRRCRLR
jgi:hypothetical protein